MHPLPTALLCGMLFVALWCYGWSPYREFRNVRLKQIKQAHIYIQEHCIDKADVRVQIGDLDKCPLAESRLESSASYDAWEDLMQSYNICPKGSCLVFSMNIFHVVGYACAALVMLIIAILLFSIYGMFSSVLQNFHGKTTLPTSMKQKKMF